MRVIGLCRFSYPGIGGFQIEHDTQEDREAYLYAPDRLESRFRTFETVTLPPLRAQTDPDFVFLVVIGDSLPEKYRTRLMALLQDIPQAIVQSHPPRRHRQIMQAAINSVREFDNDLCLQFRMDDDDAVACNYVEHLRRAAQDVQDLSKTHRHFAIDFNQGFIASPGPSGIAATPTHDPYTTPALAIAFSPQTDLTVMNFAHAKVAQKMPTVTFTGTNMMLRGHNDYNDSRQKPGVRAVNLTPLDVAGEALFKATYNIDADHVRRVFSAL
jgi:hypothetical protein